MTKRLLTDAELRAAAATRPGYATYPQYRPGRQERLAQVPLRVEVDPTRNTIDAGTIDAGAAAPMRPGHVAGDMWSSPCRQRPVGSTPAAAEPAPPALDARPPAPAAAPVVATLAELPETRVFDFQPRHIARPWWRRRWHWGVMFAGAKTRHGYAWTEAGARRRTVREVRRADR